MKRLALVLGGGASKGFAHIGVLEVLEENNIFPDVIVGTSMGAIIGASYSSGKTVKELKEKALSFKNKDLVDIGLIRGIKEGNVLRGKKLEKLVHSLLGDKEQKDLKIPFMAIATDLKTGEKIVLKDGTLYKNVLASSAVPGVFPMVEIDGRMLCDGGVKENVGTSVAKENCDGALILAVDVIGDYAEQSEETKIKLFDNLLNMCTLYMTEQTKSNKQNADMMIKITQPDVHQMDFNEESAKRAIEYGRVAMEKEIANLKQLLED